MPSGIAFHNGALYVADIDKIWRYDNAEANLDNMPQPTIVYDDMPPYVPRGWKYGVRQERLDLHRLRGRLATNASRRPRPPKSAALMWRTAPLKSSRSVCDSKFLRYLRTSPVPDR